MRLNHQELAWAGDNTKRIITIIIIIIGNSVPRVASNH
jgi:hypothetical protein